MARGRPKKDKDPFAELPGEWRFAVENGSEEEISSKLAETALESQSILDEMEKDEDFQKTKEAYRFAGEGYRERRKLVKLKQKFASRVLSSRGRLKS